MNSEEQAIYAVALAWLAECSDEELEALRAAKTVVKYLTSCQEQQNDR
jgi:hypothetical protein